MFRRRILIDEVDPTLPRDGTDVLPLQFAFSHNLCRWWDSWLPEGVASGRLDLNHPPTAEAVNKLTRSTIPETSVGGSFSPAYTQLGVEK